MRACLVSYSFYEQDNRVMRYAECLVARGDNVDVVALRRPGEPDYVELSGVRVFRIQERTRNEKGLGSYLFRILLFFFRATMFLAARSFRAQYDIVHVHSVPDFLVFTAIVPRIMGSKIILDIHDILPEFYASKFSGGTQSVMFRLMLLVERVSCRFADHVIIANHLWHKRLIGRAVSPEKCTALINYPDRSIFHPAPRNRNDENVIVMYPGTLNWHQGLDLAIRAFGQIHARAPEAEFHIYGSGPTEQELSDLILSLGLQQCVFLHKPRPLKEVAEIIAQSDLVVVPKRKDSFGNEAFSTKILEAMAVGVPVIVSDTDIDRYYFNDSVVRFFRGGDEQDLASALLQLIKDGNERRRLGRNGAEFVGDQEWSKNQWRYLEILGEFRVATKQPAESPAK